MLLAFGFWMVKGIQTVVSFVDASVDHKPACSDSGYLYWRKAGKERVVCGSHDIDNTGRSVLFRT